MRQANSGFSEGRRFKPGFSGSASQVNVTSGRFVTLLQLKGRPAQSQKQSQAIQADLQDSINRIQAATTNTTK
jgi:hypothetical protein